MNKSQLRFPVVVSAISLILAIDSCNVPQMDAGEPRRQPESASQGSGTADSGFRNYFSKTVGGPIDVEKGKRWIGNYRKANASEPNEYLISAGVLKRILSHSNCNGISLHYALDAGANLHIIPVGIDGNGAMMQSDVVYTANGEIEWEQGKEMIGNYNGKVRSHFFGANTFARLFANKTISAIRVTFATDDNGNPQLLLTDASVLEPVNFEDDSNPCPPCPF